uniref:Uncharacterized protein n=1 Tax=Ralstonia syzygii R24 TaxID=907261 RepID=G3A1J0_9RALS|nr:hypothetical protein RALSY_11085 [Ralstonia syzygii R24]
MSSAWSAYRRSQTHNLRFRPLQKQGVREISDKSWGMTVTEAVRFLDACDTWTEILRSCRAGRESHLICHLPSPRRGSRYRRIHIRWQFTHFLEKGEFLIQSCQPHSIQPFQYRGIYK